MIFEPVLADIVFSGPATQPDGLLGTGGSWSTYVDTNGDFNGRTILVTGASGGIGGATVRRLVRAGADVIAAGRTEDGLDPLAKETGCRTLAFDLTSEDSVRGACEGLDVYGVVNCGGDGGEIATPMDTDIAVFDPNTVTDNSTMEHGGLPSTGIPYVVVNGTVVVKDSEVLNDVFPGKPIRCAVTAS